MKVEIDPESGFCFGVLSAIGKAEEELRCDQQLYCLGDIVHNGMECDRLQGLGLKTINHEQFAELKDAKVLLRAHGEPPSTYNTARKNGITLIDATCPVVLKLQQRIHKQYRQLDPATQQIIIFGQKGHAEVLGLVGQTDGTATVIESADEIDRIDFNKDIFLYSQTTKSAASYNHLIEKIAGKLPQGRSFIHNNSVCGQVSHRGENIREFARRHDVILFVSGVFFATRGMEMVDEKKKEEPFFTEAHLDETEFGIMIHRFYCIPSPKYDAHTIDRSTGPDFSFYTLSPTDDTKKAVALMNTMIYKSDESLTEKARKVAKKNGITKETPLKVEWVMKHPKETVEIMRALTGEGDFLDSKSALERGYDLLTEEEKENA